MYATFIKTSKKKKERKTFNCWKIMLGVSLLLMVLFWFHK